MLIRRDQTGVPLYDPSLVSVAGILTIDLVQAFKLPDKCSPLGDIEIECIASGDSRELGPGKATEWMNIQSVDAPGDKVDQKTTHRPGDQASHGNLFDPVKIAMETSRQEKKEKNDTFAA